MDDIKNIFNETNEKAYGIYFHDNKLDINGNYFAITRQRFFNRARGFPRSGRPRDAKNMRLHTCAGRENRTLMSCDNGS